MKNSIKLGAVALVLSVSFAACGGSASKTTVDSTVTTKDTTVKVDSVKADTTKKDTTKKM